MVELLGNIERQDVISQGAQPGVSPGYVKSAFSELAQGLNAIGGVLAEKQQGEEGAQAKVEGENAVYRDTQGNLTFNPRPFDRTGRIYNDAAMMAYLSRTQPEVLTQMTKASADSNGNIASFDTWYKGFRSQMLKGKPPIMAGPLGTMLDQEYGKQKEGMLRRQDNIDITTHREAIVNGLELANEDALTLAASGGTNTPEYKQKLADMKAQADQLVSNPLFGVSREEMDVKLRRMQEAHTGEAIIGQTQRIFDEKGLQAATDFATKAFDDPSLDLDPALRRKYQNVALGAIKAGKVALLEDYKLAQETKRGLVETIKDGQIPRDDDVFANVQQLQKTGGINGVIEANDLLRRYHEAKDIIPFMHSMTPAERMERVRQMQSGGGGDPAFFRQRAQPGVSDTAIQQTNPVFSSRLQTAIDAAEQATGGKATITSMYRTTAEQQAAYDKYKSGGGGLAAPPGHSRHEIGQAADLASGPVLDWLHQHAGEYGLEFLPGWKGGHSGAFASDPGHIQLAAGGPTAAGGGQGGDAASLIRQFEGYRSAAYRDVSGYRIGYGSDTITRADGTVVRVQPGMTITQADAERDLARRMPQFQEQARTQVGGAQWDALDGATQAALTSVAYNYGSLPPEVVAAVKTGNKEAIASAVEGLSSNPGRRRQEAAIIRGGAVPGGGGGGTGGGGGYAGGDTGMDPAEHRAMQQRIAEDLNASIDSVTRGFLTDPPPTEQQLGLISDQLAFINDKATTDKVLGRLATIYNLPRETIDQMNAQIDEMSKHSLDAANQDNVNLAIAYRDKTVQELTSPDGDPYEMAVRRGQVRRPPALDFSSPASTANGIAARVNGSRLISGTYGTGPVQAFSKADALSFKSNIQPGNPGAGNAFGSVTAMPDDVMVKTMAMPEVKSAILGAVQSKDYGLYSGAMQMLGEAYGRQPAQVAAIMGKDAIDAVQDWDGRYRYYSQAEMQDHFNKMEDPQFAKQYDAAHADGLQIAKDESVKDFSGIAGKTVGSMVSVSNIEKALAPTTWTGPPHQTDPQTVAALQSDYESVFAERFATLHDRNAARAQTLDRLGSQWGFSPSNGGKLMIYPPEKFHRDVNGDKTWMKPQLENELIARGYTEGTRAPLGATMSFAPQGPTVGVHGEQAPPKPWDYSVVTDHYTESQITNGENPSYTIIVHNPTANHGFGADQVAVDLMNRPLRFQWDETAVPTDYSGYQTRRRSMEPQPLSGTRLPTSVPGGTTLGAAPTPVQGQPTPEVAPVETSVPGQIPSPVHAQPAPDESQTLEPVTGKETRLRPKQQEIRQTIGAKGLFNQ